MGTYKIPFQKMHGLGNDFVIVDNRKSENQITPNLVCRMADRRRGVGCDQFIVLENSQTADVFMRIYNPDGSESGACGNATRCVADIIMRETGDTKISIETIACILPCARDGDLISVNMGAPKEVTLNMTVQNFKGTIVNVGNPHFVTFVDDVMNVDVLGIGKILEHDPAFPNRSNIEFAEIISPHHVRMRVWERGAGVTLACGSGACSTAIAAISNGLCVSPVTITMDGGDLEITYAPATDKSVYMKGGTAHVFDGIFSDL